MNVVRLKTHNFNAVKAFLIVLIVCIHVSPDNLSTSKIIDSGLPLQVYLSQVISRIAVPLYFFLSGYLLSLGFTSSFNYKKKIKKRFKSILIPFLLWNVLYALCLVVLNKYIGFHSFLDTAETLKSKLYIVFLGPAISPLWFLRDLILFQLISIGIFYIPKAVRSFVVLGLMLIWVFYFHFPGTIISVEGALFFVLGFYNMLPLFKQLKKWKHILLAIAIVMSIADIFIRYSSLTYSLIFHRVTVYVLSVLFLYYATETGFFDKLFSKLHLFKTYSFYIFVLHFPILSVLNRFLFNENIAHYFLKIILSISISMLLGFLINKSPRISNVLTGNR